MVGRAVVFAFRWRSEQFSPTLSGTDVFGEHLLERFYQVRIRLFHGITNPAPVKLATKVPSHPFAISSPVHRVEYWTVFGDVDISEVALHIPRRSTEAEPAHRLGLIGPSILRVE